jgi:chromate transporter
MTIIALIYVHVERLQWDLSFLKYLAPIATGFIAVAAIRLGRGNLKTPLSIIITLFVAVANLSFRSPYLIPISLLASGFISFYFSRELENTERIVDLKISWRYLIVWAGLFLLLAVLGNLLGERSLLILQNNYQYGSMVFGGGQVLIPIMFEHFVHFKQYISETEFLTGYGIAQGVPGPVFSFSSFISGVSLYNETQSNLWLLMGGLAGMIGIFAPGIFFILFTFPIWNQIKRSRGVAKSLLGLNAAALGLIVSAFFLFCKDIVFQGSQTSMLMNTIIVISVVVAQLFLRMASHFIVALGILGGILSMVLTS